MTPLLLQRPPEQEQQTDNQQPTESPDQKAADSPTVELETGVELTLPADATAPEAAAIAAAVSAHLSADAATADQQTQSSEYVSNWAVARHTGAGRAARNLPRASQGDAWKLAGRLHC
ncbi:hypothetical protein [Haladaptatus sp. YSMS36]|uniref:hypothetical protein n=1 Tax=Haladaptatus sp. YSMS36 TaxID=3033384 RepID=UPI0023E84FBF|nr:hypothetical protein [Haladaptatus sp. YSMS36]